MVQSCDFKLFFFNVTRKLLPTTHTQEYLKLLYTVKKSVKKDILPIFTKVRQKQEMWFRQEPLLRAHFEERTNTFRRLRSPAGHCYPVTILDACTCATREKLEREEEGRKNCFVGRERSEAMDVGDAHTE